MQIAVTIGWFIGVGCTLFVIAAIALDVTAELVRRQRRKEDRP